jgi:predicted RNA binding protein YcfA (HicA-like mRNA interferase family)
MEKLTGFGHRQIMKKLKRSGFEFYRQAAGRHEIWYNPSTDRYTTIPDHPGDMPEGTLHAILKEAGITLEEFLNR